MILISGGTALVGDELEPLEQANILIDHGTIEQVADRSTGWVGPERIDARGLTLVPGFIDAHVHIGFYPPGSIVEGGVTTVRDLAWAPDVIFPLAKRSRRDDFAGPLILAAGPMLTVAGGYPTRAGWAPPGTGLVVASVDDARDAVAGVAAAGSAIVKVALNAEVGPTLDGPTLTAIVEAAHERGLRVTGHVYGLAELDKALDAGMDELAHMLMSRERIPDETIARMVTQGMRVVPTLAVHRGRDRRQAIENVRRFVEDGGIVVYGTDLGNAGPRPGIDAREIEAMVAAGLDGRRIIASATSTAAEWLELEDSGVLLPGKRADIVGVSGNPLKDPMALTNVKLVVRGGRVVRRP
ncbi:MAG: amidohydrolase family protein [Actinomycetota bacterium]